MSRSLWLALVLVGCSPLTPQFPQRPATGIPAAPPTLYGPWVVQGCTIVARGADVLVSTNGLLDHQGTLELRASFSPWLVRPPQASLSGLPVALPVEGKNRLYRFPLMYDATSAAHMLSSTTYLTLAYQPLGRAEVQDVSFPTAPLMEALGTLSRQCP
jgi:hypothetical protein